jgi:methyl-accepting chemotaxis protein
MKLSLKTKLSGSYVLVALFLVIVVSILSNYLVEGQFKNYVIKQQNQRSNELVSMISKQYSSDGKWDLEAIENMGINSLSQGLIIKVKDMNGNTIWDATVHNSGLCAQMLAHVSSNMSSFDPNFKGKYVENSFELKSGFNQVGTLSIGYYGPYYYNDNEILLLNTLNKLFAGLALLALILSLIVGTLMARRISTPISRVIMLLDRYQMESSVIGF